MSNKNNIKILCYNNYVKYGVRNHYEDLKESLKTTKYITEEEFNKIKKDYTFYTIDTIRNEILFIKKDNKINPLWLFVELH